ncbi:ammonia transport outward protein 2 [Physcomitrium patens]|uniref:ammonia transport outward protein 2 n=1 Tax=Physcomitrium patens TaxID=3218 RepID=UPI000D15968F|nr:ammonia transport outward protein 2-like [Physcomitrium patens]|eukprot:XP_024387042.1 ammonia transport outward protein 2-like [Physcomitrella patens]
MQKWKEKERKSAGGGLALADADADAEVLDGAAEDTTRFRGLRRAGERVCGDIHHRADETLPRSLVVGIAIPAPLGLSGLFGISPSSPPNVVTGLAAFYGGTVAFLAGMWELKRGNTFAATTFSSFGALQLSYTATLIPWFGVHDGHTDPEQDIRRANAIFLLAGTIFTFAMLLAALTLRASVALSTALFLSLTFTLIIISEFIGSSYQKGLPLYTSYPTIPPLNFIHALT